MCDEDRPQHRELRPLSCMEKNAWEVAKQVTAMVDYEPGPAKDYLKCYTMITSKFQFFSNKSYLIKLQNILFLDTTTLR